MPSSGANYKSPIRRLIALVLENSGELFAVGLYTLLNALLLLAIPLTAQGLVNVSAAGLSVQPLLVLATALLAGMLFAGLTMVGRFYLVERMRERVFVRVALQVADQLPRVRNRNLYESSGPELMNRFFEVINIQKSWFKLVFDGPSAVIEILLGLALLGLYGIELWIVATGFVTIGGVVVLASGYGGMSTSIKESNEKYRVAEWLEEMVRCQDSLRLNSRPGFWAETTDHRTWAYLQTRRQHFRVLLRQFILHYAISAFAIAAMLGFGGYLVLQGELSLGQLVAAELVIWSVVKATEKLLRSCESYFDLLTGLDKVGYITDLPLLEQRGQSLPSSKQPLAVKVENLGYAFLEGVPVLRSVSFEAQPGERLTILGHSGAGKSTLIRMLAGYLIPATGSVELDDIDVRELSPQGFGTAIGFSSGRRELFRGSVMDNVALGRPGDLRRVREILAMTGSDELFAGCERGILTEIRSAGHGLSAGQRESLLLGRAMLGDPRLLLLDETLELMSSDQREKLIQRLFQSERRPTIITTAALPEPVLASDRLLILHDGVIVEQGPPFELARRPESQFHTLFPHLALLVKTVAEDASSGGRHG